MQRTNSKILITGGAGYIGQNLASFFLKKNFKVYVIDNLSTSAPIDKVIKKNIFFYKIDLTNEKKTEHFFNKKKFDLIIHLAAFSGVQEFNKNVLKSFNNNVLATKNLVRFAFKKNNTKLIFASSAAVYGKVSKEKINEKHSCGPVNYYGLSKLACENIINHSFKNKKNNFAILRYFNVVGSIINFKITKKIYSLFDVIRNNIQKKTYKMNINGNNFQTKDGTPERDFIHISDLADIHANIFKYLGKNNNIILNCGSVYIYSVLKIIREFEKKIKRKFKLTYKLKNADETQTICADTTLLENLLKINIKKNKLNDLIKDYL
jgi:UDP-glucose 4-epimerase